MPISRRQADLEAVPPPPPVFEFLRSHLENGYSVEEVTEYLSYAQIDVSRQEVQLVLSTLAYAAVIEVRSYQSTTYYFGKEA